MEAKKYGDQEQYRDAYRELAEGAGYGGKTEQKHLDSAQRGVGRGEKEQSDRLPAAGYPDRKPALRGGGGFVQRARRQTADADAVRIFRRRVRAFAEDPRAGARRRIACRPEIFRAAGAAAQQDHGIPARDRHFASA